MKGIFKLFKKRDLSDKKEAPNQEDKYIPEELRLEKSGKKEVSPLNDLVWKFSLGILLGSFLLGLLRHMISPSSPIASWFLALTALATWGLTVRMLLLDTKFKKFWIIWLIISFILPIFLSQGGSLWLAAVGGSFFFLLFRKYRPFRHLTSRRRAVLFLLGFLAFILISTGGKSISTTETQKPVNGDVQIEYTVASETTGLGVSLSQYATGSLELFWVFSLVHLFFRARLHFMKIRLKLALSGFLIAVIPALLIIFMGLIILYGTLGATRGARVRSVLQNWTEFASTDENFIPSFFPKSFFYKGTETKIRPKQGQPPWIQEFLASLPSEGSPFAGKESINQTNYFWIDSNMWIIHIKKKESNSCQIQGGVVDSVMMDRLAKIIQGNVRFAPSMTLTIRGSEVGTLRPDAKTPPEKIQGKFIPEQDSKKNNSQEKKSLWHKPLGFGVTDVDIFELKEGKFQKQKMLLVIEVSIANVFREITSEKNPFGQAVMVSILVIAVMLLFFEALLFFFGIRITTGFTSAVRALYRGTKRIAQGDLDTKIDIPNEDELGDLASSFNFMVLAVKKGREEAVLRAHLEGELETARKIQERLLPHEMPQFPGFEIVGTSIPSKQVGGDYFDFLDLGKGRLGIAIADVSGKGIPAALLMANLQASFHSQTMETKKVGEVATRINNMIAKSTDSNMFVTFFYGLLDRSQSTFTSTNAGHNPPILWRVNKNIRRLTKGGVVLGFLPDQKYSQQTTALNPGDVLVLFTDGITEARAPDIKKIEDKLFGEERLIQVIKDNASLSAGEIQAAILQAVSTHTKNTPQEDDITLVVIKRREIKKSK